jgi:hypothetical protein
LNGVSVVTSSQNEFPKDIENHFPKEFSRELEKRLQHLAASENMDPNEWLRHGSPFFMAGLAVLLASARGFDRCEYMKLAEDLYPGSSTTEVFSVWLENTPVRAARFLPMTRKHKEFLIRIKNQTVQFL